MTDAVLKDSAATFTPGVSERRGSTTTFSHSRLKNADAQTGVSQAVNATQQYDAFGNLASSTGTWQGQFGYGSGFGYQQDSTGLKLLGHRYYDSSTGRFLTRDPIKDGRNWYGYVGNDPLGGADPSGLVSPGVGLAAIVAAAALWGGLEYFWGGNTDGRGTDAAMNGLNGAGGSLMPPIAGELAGIAELAAPLALIGISSQKRNRYANDLIEDPYGEKGEDTYDTEDDFRYGSTRVKRALVNAADQL